MGERIYDKRIVIFYVLLFLILFVFFTQVHPLVPYDGDDWANLGHSRKFALPKWHAWNPVKVLPEELFPMAGFLAAYIVNPFLHDYVFSIAVVSAFIYACLIVTYLFLFSRVLTRFFSLPAYENCALTLFFFFFHFVIFKTKEGFSPYLFGSVNLTCIYHYSIPAFLNFAVVFYILTSNILREWQKKENILKTSLFFFSVYLAIFSNIELSIILTSFIGTLLIKQYGRDLLKLKKWKSIILDTPILTGILLAWFISLVFEMTGGRSRQIGKSILSLPIKDTLLAFIHGSQINHIFLCFTIFTIVCTLLYYKKSTVSQTLKQKYAKIASISLITVFLTFIYLLLVCAKASPSYIGRSDVLIAIYSWLFVIVCASIAFLLSCKPKFCWIMPIVLLIIICEVVNPKSSYQESTMGHISAQVAYAIDYDLIHQIQIANQAGVSEMTLIVPKGDNKDNWPHPMYMGDNIAHTLYIHGIITKKTKINISPDESMNEKYQLSVQQ